jgi:hypothetical protein
MTQTGEENRRGMIRIRPYGAGFGQFDSAYKVGEGILFKAKIPFYFTHFTGQNLYWLAIRLTNRQLYSRMLTRDIHLNSATQGTMLVVMQLETKIKPLVFMSILCF